MKKKFLHTDKVRIIVSCTSSETTRAFPQAKRNKFYADGILSSTESQDGGSCDKDVQAEYPNAFFTANKMGCEEWLRDVAGPLIAAGGEINVFASIGAISAQVSLKAGMECGFEINEELLEGEAAKRLAMARKALIGPLE